MNWFVEVPSVDLPCGRVILHSHIPMMNHVGEAHHMVIGSMGWMRIVASFKRMMADDGSRLVDFPAQKDLTLLCC